MSRVWIFRYFLLFTFFLCISVGCVLAAGEDAAYIYGTPPTSGNILLKLVNNEDSLDIVAVITKGGDKTPLLALYIPSSSVGSIQKMDKGRYDVYFTSGIDWNEDKNKFNDGNYYKLKTPVILGDKNEEQILLYTDQGKIGTRIKFIDESIFPDISGTSNAPNEGASKLSSISGDKPANPSSSSEYQDTEFDQMYQANYQKINESLHQITTWLKDKNWKEADQKSQKTSGYLTDYVNQLKALSLSDSYSDKRDTYVFALQQLSLANKGISEIASLYPVYFGPEDANINSNADYDDFLNRLQSIIQTLSTAQDELDRFSKKYYSA